MSHERVIDPALMTTAPCRRCRRTMYREYLTDAPEGLVCGDGHAKACAEITAAHTPGLTEAARNCLRESPDR
jgi:hypothetical protein